MRKLYILLIFIALFALTFANECTTKCQTDYYNYIEAQRAYYGHWGAAKESVVRCPENLNDPTDKCPSDFYKCRENCNKENWDSCINACWNTLQNCCLNNVMMNAELSNKECIRKCEFENSNALAATFVSESPLNASAGLCTAFALLIMLVGIGSVLVYKK